MIALENFIYETLPEKVIFGRGRRNEILQEIKEWQTDRVLIISTNGRRNIAEEIWSQLGEKAVGLHTSAKQHVPQESVKEAVGIIQNNRADALLTVGGGSAIGLAKAAVLETKLPILAVPTTYSGSEMTPVWGITKDNKKQTGRNSQVKPKTVIYDSELTETMPPYMSLTSGVNAMAHCVEALYAEKRNPITSIIAEEGFRALFHSLESIVREPEHKGAREEAFYGSWLAGMALASVDMSLHHKLCHALGGIAALPHAETHTIMLPYVLSYNASNTSKVLTKLGKIMNVPAHDVPDHLHHWIINSGGPSALSEIGWQKQNITQIAEEVSEKAYPNPRPVNKENMENLLQSAFIGEICNL
ncbi:maleylacetate reductase [Salibacterium aidingense]|uniref:maleylacetate reductase n=1 Tax=Salibacterium aidingense TaxID=384933 RepID=UPI000684403B|nr:maleylacetate reductase [Salibacterium aidingense]